MATLTLGRRLILTNIALTIGLLLLVSTSLVGMMQLRRQVLDVVDEYDEVRLIEASLRHVQAARAVVQSDVIDGVTLSAELNAARSTLDEFVAFQEGELEEDAEHQATELAEASDLIERLQHLSESTTARRTSSALSASQLKTEIAALVDGLLRLESTTDVIETRSSLTRSTAFAVGLTGGISIILCIGSVLLSARGYRQTVPPIRSLQAGVRQVAAGQFRDRLDLQGDVEIMGLVEDFNHMATELDTLYRVMEEKVAQKSRELVRAERLASVGYLAAGVAHEINNPLSIITGYAEMSLRWLDGEPDADQIKETRSALATIRSEAFRCKDVTTQLTSLSRSEGQPCRLSVSAVMNDVLTLASALRGYQTRTIDIQTEAVHDVYVDVNEAELKQVLLNLIINAVEATDPTSGRISIVAEVAAGRATVAITDNGCGLAADDLPHVFEPFWTNRSQGRERGLGLGLSISHAIIERHGGRLIAASDGPDRGSCFRVELPIATPNGEMNV